MSHLHDTMRQEILTIAGCIVVDLMQFIDTRGLYSYAVYILMDTKTVDVYCFTISTHIS